MPQRFPPWLHKRLPAGGGVETTRALLAGLGLNTVCQSARCPNQGECFARHTATFMIMGDTCTRDCRFCAVGHGQPAALDAGEPSRLAQAAAKLKLKHVVVTSVTRDDLPDGGAAHFAATIAAVRARLPEAIIEVLTPDFRGDQAAIEAVMAARPHIFNHNVETVPRLYPAVRPQASFALSLAVLAGAKERGAGAYTKSGLMVGLGESEDEVSAVMAELRAAGCDILTIGQYLRPSASHLPVAEYVTPEQFERYAARGKELGFAFVAASPFVRSSYNAGQFFQAMLARETAAAGGQ